MPGKPPSEQELLTYVVQTHDADRIQVTLREIQHTLAIRRGQVQGATNPHAVGHLEAFNFIFKSLVNSQDFPCKDVRLLKNRYDSDTSLWWLRELHTIMMYPVASQAVTMGMSLRENTIQPGECGVYRVRPRNLAFAKAPDPEQIQPLLHAWLTDIATFNDEIKDKISNPYGLDRTEAEQLYQKSFDANLFLSCLQPFEDGNNRIARLIENALRLKWNMPWKPCSSQDPKTMDALSRYQTEGMKKWMKLI
jgi:hypothetical protein